MEVVDAYSHCGVSKYKSIENVRQVMQTAGVSHVVLVQHMEEFDNTYLQQVVSEDPAHLAGVCLVDHEHPDAADTLRGWHATGCFQGVRLTPDACTAVPELFRVAVELGMVVVLFTPNGIVSEFSRMQALFEQHPDARCVLTHMGNPDLNDAPEFASYAPVFGLARYRNVYWQLSGMNSFCPHPHQPLHDLIRQAAAHFGTDRIYWGSDYPVVGSAEDYVADLRLLLDGNLPLPATELATVAGGNARQLWFR